MNHELLLCSSLCDYFCLQVLDQLKLLEEHLEEHLEELAEV